MSLPAFWLPGAWTAECSLTGDEFRHFQVLRIKTGEEVIILNGVGKTGICKVAAIGKRAATLLLEREWDTPRPESRATIALALSKAVRRGFFLEKAAELGAWTVWLWQAERSQGQLTEKLALAAAQQIRAGAKQCHNPWFPQMKTCSGAEALARASADYSWQLLPWEAKADERLLAPEQTGLPGDTIYVIGPEGGLSQSEADCFLAFGFVPVSLGKRLLRCETAATFCLSLHYWSAQLRADND